MKLFDFLKILFGKSTTWDKLTNYDKSRNIFMTQRFMAIKWPTQANLFNKLNTDSVGVINSWRMVTSQFNRVPGFIYTKVRKQPKIKKWQPDPEYVKIYMKLNEIGKREFDEAMMFNEPQVKIAIDKIQKQC